MKRISILLAGLGMAASAALAQDAPPPDEAIQESGEASAPTELSPEQAELARRCSARKFETTVILPGRTSASNVRICGEEGQSDAEWLETLKDSARKTEASAEMEPDVKEQILAALKAEIELIEAALAPPAFEKSLESFALTPEPAPMREPAPQYSSVPPLPAPKRTAPVALSGSSLRGGPVAQPKPPVPRPRLSIACALPGETAADCEELEIETRIVVRAGEPLAAGTKLRFVRGTNARAELDLAGLQSGQSLRSKLPGRVCAGVMRGKVTIEVLNKGQVADSLGPYRLRCGT